jgi:serpin B
MGWRARCWVAARRAQPTQFYIEQGSGMRMPAGVVRGNPETWVVSFRSFLKLGKLQPEDYKRKEGVLLLKKEEDNIAHKERSAMKIPVFLMLSTLVATTFSCTKDNNNDNDNNNNINATNLMSEISPNAPDGKALDNMFVENAAGFFVELFKNTTKEKGNSLISPVSVVLALSMTANGADNNTLSEMETVLGRGIPLSELNRYLYTYANELPSEAKSKLYIANSIWFRDGLQVKKDFLQTNADYYGAKAYQSAFDETTLDDINLWVKTNTFEMIDKMLEKIGDDAVMYLINAVAFDAEWQKIYEKTDVHTGEFNNIHGQKQTVEFMSSDENTYLEDDKAIGFMKPYALNKYNFVALLPNENISMEEYVASLSGAKFINILKKAQHASVVARLPKFSYDYEISMNAALKALGMSEAFHHQKADFSKMAVPPPGGNLFISNVLHKSFIEVNERGTRAGAATSVEVSVESAPMVQKQVILNRPFVYAIVDNATNLPVFMGVVATIE